MLWENVLRGVLYQLFGVCFLPFHPAKSDWWPAQVGSLRVLVFTGSHMRFTATPNVIMYLHTVLLYHTCCGVNTCMVMCCL